MNREQLKALVLSRESTQEVREAALSDLLDEVRQDSYADGYSDGHLNGIKGWA
jgi:hypothetical protein